MSHDAAAAAFPSPRENRAAMPWGIAVGLLQAATPLVIWWLDRATVYALGLVVIAGIYVGFAVADGRAKVIAVESGSADHTSELQPPVHIVCPLLPEKKKSKAAASPRTPKSNTSESTSPTIICVLFLLEY